MPALPNAITFCLENGNARDIAELIESSSYTGMVDEYLALAPPLRLEVGLLLSEKAHFVIGRALFARTGPPEQADSFKGETYSSIMHLFGLGPGQNA